MAAEGARARSGAFPFELAYRLIDMFSVKGDLVLDPFVGSGTTILAAMCAGRNSVAETYWKIEYSPAAGLILKL
jgi:DNA modification methylase